MFGFNEEQIAWFGLTVGVREEHLHAHHHRATS